MSNSEDQKLKMVKWLDKNGIPNFSLEFNQYIRDMYGEIIRHYKNTNYTLEEKGSVTRPKYNTPIVLEMTSRDVLHSFYVPSFRVKRDTVPGMNSYLSFTPTKKGDFNIFCTEFCGTSHSRMRGIVRVVSKERFEKWANREYKEANITDPVELGYRIYSKNCATCHSTGANRIIGPGFQGLYGKKREFVNGEAEVANDEYIKNSIYYPGQKIVKGYDNKMNAWEGVLTDKDVEHLIAYIKTLK